MEGKDGLGVGDDRRERLEDRGQGCHVISTHMTRKGNQIGICFVLFGLQLVERNEESWRK